MSYCMIEATLDPSGEIGILDLLKGTLRSLYPFILTHLPWGIVADQYHRCRAELVCVLCKGTEGSSTSHLGCARPDHLREGERGGERGGAGYTLHKCTHYTSSISVAVGRPRYVHMYS